MTKNPNYRQFLDKGEITLITQEQISSALRNIKGRHYKEARALLIALFYTGARPNEILQTKSRDIDKTGPHATYLVKGSKRGLTRTIYLPLKNPHVRELYDYARRQYPDSLLFYHYIGRGTKTTTNKRGDTKTHRETTAKLRYHVKKWFRGIIPDSINPYFLRHNRFSQLSQAGVGMEDIRILKGARKADSVSYYTHLSSKTARDIAKKIK